MYLHGNLKTGAGICLSQCWFGNPGAETLIPGCQGKQNYRTKPHTTWHDENKSMKAHSFIKRDQFNNTNRMQITATCTSVTKGKCRKLGFALPLVLRSLLFFTVTNTRYVSLLGSFNHVQSRNATFGKCAVLNPTNLRANTSNLAKQQTLDDTEIRTGNVHESHLNSAPKTRRNLPRELPQKNQVDSCSQGLENPSLIAVIPTKILAVYSERSLCIPTPRTPP